MDIDLLRSDFPSLSSGTAHFDGPGGTQAPRAVGQAIADALTGPLSNRGGSVLSERNSDAIVHNFRSAYADLLGADSRGIVYGRSATQLTYDFSRHLEKTFGPGDEIVVSRLDHDSNVRPWIQCAERCGATVRWIEFDASTATVTLDHVAAALSSKTRLVALTGASNLVGTMPPLASISHMVHEAGALFYVDGVHYTAHALVDVSAIGADFFVCSPYKFFGPHCAVLAASPDLLETLSPDKLLPSSNAVPERFEFGTLPYEIMAGATAAVDYLAAVVTGGGTRREQLSRSHAATTAHELSLREAVEHGLKSLGSGVTLYSRAEQRTPTLLFTLDSVPSRDISASLAAQNILAPSGSFYAYEPFRCLDVKDVGAVRVGLAPYNSASDVERLIGALSELVT